MRKERWGENIENEREKEQKDVYDFSRFSFHLQYPSQMKQDIKLK